MEEAAYIKPECFFEVILPLIQIASSALIAITTVAEKEDNYISELARKNVFRKLPIVTACDVCKRSGKISTCDHKTSIVPDHIDPSRRELIRNIYGEERDEQYAREAGGIATKGANLCFDKEAVLKIFSQRSGPIDHSPPFVFVTIDPCGGSVSQSSSVSDFALCLHIGPCMKIIGLEAFYVDNMRTATARVLQVFKKIREHRLLVQSRLVVTTEGNLGNEAGWLKEAIQKDNYNVIAKRKDVESTYGIGQGNSVTF